MKTLAAVALALSFLLARSASAGENETLAQQAAKEWLALVDGGDYDRSWDQAASLFKLAVTKADWEKAAKAARAPLGALKSRQFRSANYARSLPGAPDGEYVVIQYASRFDNKAAAIETITPMRDKDGHWRVSGYYIK